MRTVLLASLIVLPTLASAQTASDLARLAPLGAPSISAAPSATNAQAATGADLARLLDLNASHSIARAYAAAPGALSGSALARAEAPLDTAATVRVASH